MENSNKDIFSEVDNLKNNWKYEEALELLDKLEETPHLTSHDLFNIQFQKAFLHFELYQLEEALKFSNLAYKSGQELKNKSYTIETLILKSKILRTMHRGNDALNLVIKVDDIYRTIENPLTDELKLLLGQININKAGCYLSLGDTSLTLKSLNESLKIAKEIKNLNLEMHTVKGFKFLYDLKGEYEDVFESTKRYLELANYLADKQEIIGAHNSFGISLIDKGEYKQAIHHLEKGLRICNEIKSWKTFIVLSSLFEAYIGLGYFDKAQSCYLQMKENFNKYDSEFNKVILQLEEAELLKNTEPKDLSQAELIFKEIAANKEIFSFHRFYALVNLCDLILNKLRKTNDLKFLDEIQGLINEIESLADDNDLFSLKAESLSFRARIKLLTFDFKEAKNLAKKALTITEKYDQPELAKRIRNVEDNLTKDFIKWEHLKKVRADFTDRMDLARLDEQIQILLQKRSYFKTIMKEKSSK